MHMIPAILTTAHGEIGLFDRGPSASGQHVWDVARPCPKGWEALGTVTATGDGYSASGPFPMRAVATVPDAAAMLVDVAAKWDRQHGAEPALRTVPADDVGPGGRVYL